MSGGLGSSLEPLLALLAHSDDLEDLVLVQVLKARAPDHLIVVLLCKEQASLLQPLTVESVGILEDLAHVLHVDVLRQDVLALLLERGHVESVSQLYQIT